jgi:HlyD family secretion protein
MLVAISAVAGACARDPASDPVLGTLERDRIELSAESNDPIAEIAVREGDRVRAGELILRQDDARMAAQRAMAEGARDQARARLAELERGPRAQRISEARARLTGAESALAIASRELERERTLASESVRSRAELDRALGNRDEARAQRDRARAELDALLEGSTAEELAQARSAADAAEAALRDAELRLSRMRVVAPSEGQVDALPFEIGERPQPGATVAVLLRAGAPYARVYLPEAIRVRVAPGTPARVSIAGIEREFRAHLRTVSHEAAFTPYYALTQHDRGHLAYLAEVALNEAEAHGLPTGVPVEARFELAAPTPARGGEPAASGASDAAAGAP